MKAAVLNAQDAFHTVMSNSVYQILLDQICEMAPVYTTSAQNSNTSKLGTPVNMLHHISKYEETSKGPMRSHGTFTGPETNHTDSGWHADNNRWRLPQIWRILFHETDGLSFKSSRLKRRPMEYFASSFGRELVRNLCEEHLSWTDS